MTSKAQSPKREFLENLFSFGNTYGERDPKAIEALLERFGESQVGMTQVALQAPVASPPMHFSGQTVAHRRLVAAGAAWLAGQGHDWSATDLEYEAGRADLLARKARIAVECGYTKASKMLVAMDNGWRVMVVPYPADTGLSRSGFLFEPPREMRVPGKELAGIVERLRALGREDRSQAKGTMEAYGLHWRRFKQWCEEGNLSALPAEPQTVALFLADKARARPSAKTARLAIYAIRWFHLQAGFASPIDRPEVEETLAGIRRLDTSTRAEKEEMTVEARRAALEHIENPAVRLMLLCRASSSEVAGLQKEDLMEAEGRWVVSVKGRGGRRRPVEIPEELAVQLQKLRRKPGVVSLITSRNGRAMTRFGIFKQVKRAFVEVGLPPATPKSIRQAEGASAEL
jgi:integrase